MFKKRGAFTFLLKYTILIAILSSIPMLFYIRDARFSETWLLYLGNAFVLAGVFPLMIYFNKKFGNEDADTGAMITAGLIITSITIIIILIIAILLLIIFIPGLFSRGMAGKILTQAPLNKVEDKTNGLLFIVILNVLFGNFIAGSFSSLITAFTAKKNQKEPD